MPTFWHFRSKKSIRKIEKIQEKCLQTILDDHESNYDASLHKPGKSTMEVIRLRTLAIEIFKTMNNQNPSFMREIFYWSPYVSHKKQNLFVQSHKTAAFGDKSLKILDPQNSLPGKIKLVTNLVDFKNSKWKWFDLKCTCNISFKNEMQKIGHGNLALHTFIFIQFYIYFNDLTDLVKGYWGWRKLGVVSVLIRLYAWF